jgi:hypothetical protein
VAGDGRSLRTVSSGISRAVSTDRRANTERIRPQFPVMGPCWRWVQFPSHGGLDQGAAKGELGPPRSPRLPFRYRGDADESGGRRRPNIAAGRARELLAITLHGARRDSRLPRRSGLAVVPRALPSRRGRIEGPHKPHHQDHRGSVWANLPDINETLVRAIRIPGLDAAVEAARSLVSKSHAPTRTNRAGTAGPRR